MRDLTKRKKYFTSLFPCLCILINHTAKYEPICLLMVWSSWLGLFNLTKKSYKSILLKNG